MVSTVTAPTTRTAVGGKAKEREVMDRMTAQKHIPAGEKVAIWLTAGERKLRSPDEQAGAEAVGQAARTTLHGLHGPIYS